MNRKATRVGNFEVCVSTHVSLRMFIMQVLASQLPFLANRNAELAVPPLFWPDNCIKIGGHVVLLSGPTVYTLYCASTNSQSELATPKSMPYIFDRCLFYQYNLGETLRKLISHAQRKDADTRLPAYASKGSRNLLLTVLFIL